MDMCSSEKAQAAIELIRLTDYCDSLLQINCIKDFPNALNGLQIANTGRVTKIGSAVDANRLAIQAAIEANIDFLIVHHGLFWSGPQQLTNERYLLYREIFENNLAIYSAHLPLDAHNVIGNNALIANALDIQIIDTFAEFEGTPIGKIAKWETTRSQLWHRVKALFPHAKAMEFGSPTPSKIGILSGSGGNIVIEALKKANLDTLITGEVRYSMYTLAQEEKLNVYVCGHYATEVFGARTMGEMVANNFGLPQTFINAPFDL